MDVKQVKLIYFSATGTTQKVLESIAVVLVLKAVPLVRGLWKTT